MVATCGLTKYNVVSGPRRLIILGHRKGLGPSKSRASGA